MKTFQNKVSIDAPAEHIWSVMLAMEQWPEWTASMTRLQRLHDMRPGPDCVVRISQPGFPDADWTITEWEPGRCFTWVSRRPGFVARATHLIEPAPVGCVVTLVVDFGGLFGGLVGLLMANTTQRFMDMEAAGLKQHCESTRPAPA